jgi:hypothetical protein
MSKDNSNWGIIVKCYVCFALQKNVIFARASHCCVCCLVDSFNDVRLIQIINIHIREDYSLLVYDVLYFR